MFEKSALNLMSGILIMDARRSDARARMIAALQTLATGGLESEISERAHNEIL